jgi:hypothetical protein
VNYKPPEWSDKTFNCAPMGSPQRQKPWRCKATLLGARWFKSESIAEEARAERAHLHLSREAPKVSRDLGQRDTRGLMGRLSSMTNWSAPLLGRALGYLESKNRGEEIWSTI